MAISPGTAGRSSTPVVVRLRSEGEFFTLRFVNWGWEAGLFCGGRVAFDHGVAFSLHPPRGVKQPKR